MHWIVFYVRKQVVACKDEWSRRIKYLVEIGVVFKDVLSISADGVSWKGKSITLKFIIQVRCGAMFF